jgi:glycosyltransferase involved in cell wall biosynthesis
LIKKKKLVSILVDNFNKARFVSRCLDSLLVQNFKNFEVIFVDDRSTDNSIDIAKKYEKKLDIKIIQTSKKSKYGCYNQMNCFLEAFKKSTGEIILFLDSDDFFHKKKIYNIVKFFKISKNFNKNIIFDLPYIYYSSTNIKEFKIRNKYSNTIWPHFPPQSCISMKRDFLKKIFPKIFFKKFYNIAFDFRLAFYSYFISKNFEILEKRLTYYFVDPTGISSQFRYLSYKWWERRFEAYNFYSYMYKKFSLKFLITFDYLLTRIVFKFFYFKNKIIS